MCLAATLAVFADLHLVLTPVVSSDFVLQGDFLRVVAYGVLLVGVWRAISEAEFGRAVADERARVARDIHDGLAQYLFAISTQVSMLEDGRPARRGPATAEARGDGRAAGSAVCRSRALVGGRLGAVRLGAAPLRRGADGGRRARRRARRRPAGQARAGRADRGVQDRAGRARKCAPPCRGEPCRRLDLPAKRSTRRHRGGRRRRLRRDGRARRPGHRRTCARGPRRSTARSRCVRAPGAARRSRSCCALREHEFRTAFARNS